MRVEYRVRPITRYVVTRFHEQSAAGGSAGVETRGEYDNADTAFDVAYALCRLEHEQLGYPIGDERVQYPRRDDLTAATVPAKPSLSVGDLAS